MNINIKTISHKKQRYETIGDWIVKDGEIKQILVSYMHNEDYAFLVAYHELIEAKLCLKAGISQKEIDNFDLDYEASRESGITARCGCKPTKDSEPGHDRHAPYGKFHRYAEDLERKMARAIGVNWTKYNKTVLSL